LHLKFSFSNASNSPAFKITIRKLITILPQWIPRTIIEKKGVKEREWEGDREAKSLFNLKILILRLLLFQNFESNVR